MVDRLNEQNEQIVTRRPRAFTAEDYPWPGGCAARGHLYGGPDGWRACACGRAMPAHADTAPDPAGGSGCGMVWRVCARCPHIDEHHLTDHQGLYTDRAGAARETVTEVWPPVVTLCGSMRFAEQIGRVAAEETAGGAIVLAPFVVVAAGDQGGPGKAMLDELHRRKIDMADRVVVVSDASGYIGDSTRAEIAHAARVGVPVTYRHVTAASATSAAGAAVEPDEGLEVLADVADVLAGAEVERMRPRDVLAALAASDRVVYGRWTVADLRAALPVCAQPYKSGGTQQIALSRVREALAARGRIEHGPTVARSA